MHPNAVELAMWYRNKVTDLGVLSRAIAACTSRINEGHSLYLLKRCGLRYFDSPNCSDNPRYRIQARNFYCYDGPWREYWSEEEDMGKLSQDDLNKALIAIRPSQRFSIVECLPESLREGWTKFFMENWAQKIALDKEMKREYKKGVLNAVLPQPREVVAVEMDF
jgi:hypothetical protein